MTTPSVSILIPCHNAQDWLAMAVESALSQTANVEVIVYDDGSTDDSVAVAESFGDKIQFVSRENRGAPTARNELLKQAKGEWVQYLDADDYLMPDKVSSQLKALDADPDVDVLYGPVWVEWHDREPAYLDRSAIPEPHDPWRLLALWHLPQTGGPLWRKQAILDVGGWKADQPCCQEHELYLRLLKAEKRFRHTSDGGAVYRRFPDGTVSTRNLQLVRSERFKIEAAIEEHLLRNNALTPEREWAINQARFEMARNAWAIDKDEARRFYAPIKRSKSKFSPSGAAAPKSYRLLYRFLGFEQTEHIAKLSRAFVGAMRSKRA